MSDQFTNIESLTEAELSRFSDDELKALYEKQAPTTEALLEKHERERSQRNEHERELYESFKSLGMDDQAAQTAARGRR